jgi:hypothetical protein
LASAGHREAVCGDGAGLSHLDAELLGARKKKGPKV